VQMRGIEPRLPILEIALLTVTSHLHIKRIGVFLFFPIKTFLVAETNP